MVDSGTARAPAANSAAVIEAAEARLGERWAQYTKTNLERIADYLAFGRALLAEKRAVPHGEFLPMLARIGIGKRTAQRAIKLARTGLPKTTIDAFGGIQSTLAMGDTMLEIFNSDPAAAAKLATLKREIAEHEHGLAELHEQQRDNVARLLASVARFRAGIDAHRRNAWTPENDLATMEAEAVEWEAHAHAALEHVSHDPGGTIH